MRFDAGPARMAVDLEHGGRIASLVVDGRELLVTSGFGSFSWGSFPMAPFAGRLRDARLEFAGRTYELPANEPPHALHGFAFERPWHVVDGEPSTIACELGLSWPFRGRVRQRFALAPDRLDVAMELEADEPQPAVIGLHPWFRRRLVAGSGMDARRDGAPLGGALELEVEPSAMYRLGPDGIPTGELVPPDPRPWDDCFVGLAGPPILRWPGALRMTVESTADHWVIYDEQVEGICVEPQTGPPNGPNLAPRIVMPGDPLRIAMIWRWTPDDGAGEADPEAESARRR
jgi:aldose 1-epimerase